ncbi:hypothetical protein [Escherichia coli]|uniref:hypothetical protein n=1 Tax=Escherichia coli TaxID=562 RepID=UPI003D190005
MFDAGFFFALLLLIVLMRSSPCCDPFFSFILASVFAQAAPRLASLFDGFLMRSLRDRFSSRVKYENSFNIMRFYCSCHLCDRKNPSENCKKFQNVKFQIFAFPSVTTRAGGYFCTAEN